ncbi:hypothetical protein C5C31_05335 [Rathayibacter rathayi]|uniref:4'-phosphopantetheinyl transferase domain-containing protein n=1 Tax=Rathayibacter rathayi TaxID=33887 RepID=A0ABD6W7G3_RATRA|nr:hypothetical protein C1O28_02565 [Rathayibacter rathayi]PPF13013.1 hypothetical protein C5C04_09890 [Rathayibacter rathayi]PPF48089.1 hypothetical protein C5C08_09770 [Rathayibacter rathayi]PPF82072.1 hypothetical protein C5C14_03820 [Rathayibacter rathayi]PPG14809.1 hypothetical protein C5C11_04100 [Rathayibacter rathayi]
MSPDDLSLAGRELVRDLLDETGWAEWTSIDCAANGRPVLRGQPDVGVSISHSRGWVMAGIARDADIGVDVEVISAVFDQPALERMACSLTETKHLQGRSGLARRAAMADLWTEKEAILKAAGVGLVVDPRLASSLGAEVFRVVPGETGISACIALLHRRGDDDGGSRR